MVSFPPFSPPRPYKPPLLTHTRHMPSPSHSSRFYHPHNIGSFWHLSSGKRVVPCGRTDRLTEMMKPTVAFRNFAKTRLKKYKILLPSVLYLPSCILSTSFHPKLCVYLTLPAHDCLNSAVFASLKTAVL